MPHARRNNESLMSSSPPSFPGTETRIRGFATHRPSGGTLALRWQEPWTCTGEHSSTNVGKAFVLFRVSAAVKR
jgi:hypothetical protein